MLPTYIVHGKVKITNVPSSIVHCEYRMLPTYLPTLSMETSKCYLRTYIVNRKLKKLPTYVINRKLNFLPTYVSS